MAKLAEGEFAKFNFCTYQILVYYHKITNRHTHKHTHTHTHTHTHIYIYYKHNGINNIIHKYKNYIKYIYI